MSSFTFQVADNGGTARRGTDMDPVPKVMTLKRPNSPPTGADKTIEVPDDAPYVFTVSDFPIVDREGNQLSRVKVTTIPADEGELFITAKLGEPNPAGGPVIEGQEVSVADIMLGRFVFIPT